MSHPTSHEQHVLNNSGVLPFADNRFDLIVSDYVFEHIEEPSVVSRELTRVLKPGGWLLVRTPNKYGYLRLASSLVPNRLHNAVLRSVQPHRKAVDTFPTFYRLNSPGDMRRHFPGCTVATLTESWEPAYFFGRTWAYRMFRGMHRILPKRVGTAHVFIVHKAPIA